MTTWTQLVDTYPTTGVAWGGGWRVTTITQWVDSTPLASRELTATAGTSFNPVLFQYYGLYPTHVTGNMQSIAFMTLDDDRFTFSTQAGGFGVLPNVTLVQDIPLPSAAILFLLALVVLQLIIRSLTNCLGPYQEESRP